jgi:hypothetical protein
MLANQDFLFVIKPLRGLHKHELTLSLEVDPSSIVGDASPAEGHGTNEQTAVSNIVQKLRCDYTIVDLIHDKVIDHTQLPYKQMEICGFTICYEDGVFESFPDFYDSLVADFEMMCNLFPPRAIELLRPTTHLWINKTLVYGPVSRYLTCDFTGIFSLIIVDVSVLSDPSMALERASTPVKTGWSRWGSRRRSTAASRCTMSQSIWPLAICGGWAASWYTSTRTLSITRPWRTATTTQILYRCLILRCRRVCTTQLLCMVVKG